jgi:predicted DsbA family dithiol-disulfide isomerase
MVVEMWSDFVCPWCYIGKRRFERARAGFEHGGELQVVHRSFQLNPGAPKTGTTSRVEYLRLKYRLSEDEVAAMDARMVETASAEGLDYRLAGTVTGNTLDAHRLLQLARERGLADAVAERFFRAYFTEQRSLFEPASLMPLAVEAGLKEDDVRGVLGSEAYADAVAQDNHDASAAGARGVPFFVIDRRYGVSGAQPANVLGQTLAQAWQERSLSRA